ncbi:MAG: autotransporter outer membrane beta-barrel domain-containing protein [Sinobacterium sp.]|nr:autotransporter outer membrane beta-barrel domain-containing protein [Sinobacterium sp.]
MTSLDQRCSNQPHTRCYRLLHRGLMPLKSLYLTFILIVCSVSAQASLTSDYMMSQYTSEIETQAAIANQATYESMKTTYQCEDDAVQGSNLCTGEKFNVWSNVRELVHTANRITQKNCGLPQCPSRLPVNFDMEIDEQSLGFSLRWTAGEEFSTQKDLTDSFISSALSGLESRISAIRSGARGFTLAINQLHTDDALYADLHPEIGYMSQAALGGGASDANGIAWSPWGGFLNASYTWGDKDASLQEAAYDFDGFSINAGFDYRANTSWVLGTTFSVSNQRIDFDSTQSIVDGEVEMNALSVTPFALFQTAHWFILSSVNYQYSKFDTQRDIKYATNKAGESSADTSAVSTNNSDTYGVNFSAGYYFIPPEFPRFAFEPFISAGYHYTKIDAYSEKDLQNTGFNFLISEQTLNSLETSFGMKAQMTFTPSFAVLIPFIEAQWFNQYEDSPHVVEANYQEAGTLSSAATFEMEINPPEDTYAVYTAGLSSVITGSKQKGIEGVSTGGIQAFVSYSMVKGIAYYSQQMVTAGMRYEF